MSLEIEHNGNDIADWEPTNFLQKYIMGDIVCLNRWLENKPFILNFGNWIFRAIGAPIFLNNPISGLLILIGMLIATPWVAANAMIGLLVAVIVALALKLDRSSIASGGLTFHGMLVGLALASSFNKQQHYAWVIIPVIVLSAISVYVASGLGTLCARVGLPAFNLPFNLVTFVFMAACGVNNHHFPLSDVSVSSNDTFRNSLPLSWGQIFLGLPNSLAQIYGSASPVAGGLILLAMLVASPIILVHSVLGSFVAIFIALSVAAPPVQIAQGVWGFNAVLSCASLGGVFLVINVHSSILAFISAIFSTLIFGALGTVLAPARLPALAFPFNISASILLSVSSSRVYRIPLNRVRYPELHFVLHKRNKVGHVADDRQNGADA
ncbi:urea transporter 1-like [Tubulanus polymorphus]|uniref:urea transporter 1-like n=1 Tax=Tubulanus polymorphus TaxID=672921 RepID=UPI003DA64AC5